MEDSEQSYSVSSGTVLDPQDPWRNIQLTGIGLPFTSPDEGIRKSQPLPEGPTIDPKDSGGNVQPADTRLPSMFPNKGTAKTTSYPEGPLGDKDLEGNKPPADMEPINLSVVGPSKTGAEYQESDEEEVFAVGEDMDKDNQDTDSSSPDILKKYDNILPLNERQLEAVKDNPTLNKKVIEATESYTKNSTNLTELFTLVKSFDFNSLMSAVESLKATTLSQDKHLGEWAKSSTYRAWNLGLRLTAIKHSQATIRSEVSSFKSDTSKIKPMMTEIYNAFKGQPLFASLGSVPPTLALTEIPASVEEKNDNTATKEHHFH
ncbi:hypothetical protein Tco_0379646, partial [Tanacetum coccineum]